MIFPLEQRESYLKIDGEQQDANTGFYNLRARWMNPSIGRFQSMDTYEGDQKNPLGLHKYLFGSNNPINRMDPSGNDDIVSNALNTVLVLWPAELKGRIPINLLNLSNNGRLFIRWFEEIPQGSGQPAYKTYYDGSAKAPPDGYPTIGFGHKEDSDEVTENANGITLDDANDYFDDDLQDFIHYTKHYVHVPLYQFEFDAITSLIFNSGPGTFEKSALIIRINNSDYQGAGYMIPGYSIQAAPGLGARRIKEQRLFQKGIYQ